MLSVSSEAASNLAFQGAPPRAERSHQSPANDLFDALVSHNAAPDVAAAPPPAPSSRRSDEKPPPAEATAANSPSNPPPGNDAARGADATAPPANANAHANGPGDGGASQSQVAKTAGAKGDPAKTADQQTSGDTPADPTILAQQATVTTPAPVAVAVSVSTAATNAPAAAPTSGGSAAPLAIAAAAIATTSQTLSGQVTTPPQGRTDSSPGPTAATSGSTAANTPALSAPGIKGAASVASSAADASPVISQARQLGTAPANAASLNSAVAAAATKTASDKTSSSAASDNPDDADPTATNAPVVAQNGQQQPAATGKPDAANAAAILATTEAAASSSSVLSAHEHGQAANTGHPLSETADPPVQAFGALQPQPNSVTAPAAGGALSVATAANGPVPLNGLALEIAASIKSGKSRFEIRLDPADLGRIDVRIDIDRNGQVTSHLTVERPETLSILRQDAPLLQRALDDAGVKTGSGGLQFSLRDQSSSGQNNGADSRPNAQRLIITDEDTIPAAAAGRSYGRSFAGSSGVDIRV